MIDKNKNSLDAVKNLNKELGVGAAMLLGQKNNGKVETISSGSLVIDEALGIGGYPKGKIIEVGGPYASGKTTLFIHAIAEAQKKNGIVALIDPTGDFDPEYAKALGVDTDNLIISQPDSIDKALTISETLTKTGSISLIVVNSLGSLDFEDKAMCDSDISNNLAIYFRKISNAAKKTGTTLFYVNPIKEEISPMFGVEKETPLLRAFKYAAAIRMETKRITSIASEIKHNNIKVKVCKNKFAAPYKIGMIEIAFSQGISKEADILNLGEKYKVIGRNSSWFTVNNDSVAQGRFSMLEYLKNNVKTANKLIEEICKKSDVLKTENPKQYFALDNKKSKERERVKNG